MTQTVHPPQTTVTRAVTTGIAAGVVGAVAMAVFAMIAAATYQHHGFFTPMYHIASLFLRPDYMMTSVGKAAEGSAFYFTAGPAALGLLIHVVVGAGYGVVFALAARSLRLGRAAVVPAGILFGFVALAFSSFVGLPLAAGLFNAGDPIRDMPTMAGWNTFIAEHAIFGLVLGVVATGLLFRSREDRTAASWEPAAAA